MILLVTYELKGPPGSYADLFNTLKSQHGWWHYMRATWLVSTDSTPQELFELLKPHIKQNDRILVTRLGDRQGWLPKAAWDWIRKNSR